jgi:beta-xylosidase
LVAALACTATPFVAACSDSNAGDGAVRAGRDGAGTGGVGAAGRASVAGTTATGGASASGSGGSPSMGGTPSSGGAAAGGDASSGATAGAGNVASAGGGGLGVAGQSANGGTGEGGSPVGGAGGVAAAGAGGGAGAAGSSAGAPAVCPATFKNPLLWEDLADLELIRVDDTYYYTASTMHFSPGAPILRSYDLVNWEYIGHSVPALDFDKSYDLNGGHAYINGIWASTLQYRKSNKTFYWMGCMHNVGGGYVYTATAPEGPWTKHKSSGCYYDMGLLIDEDDTMYVAYGNTTISVAQLSADGFSQVKNQQVFTSPSDLGPLEGSRFYKVDGNYYILTTQYANGEYVLRSTSGPFGPYTLQPFAAKVKTPLSGAGYPHQGGLIQTQNGDWYYGSFLDAYPGGRIPSLAPVTWKDGWPVLTLSNGGWGATYPFPNLPCGAGRVKPLTGTDTFLTAALGPEWEWNHNPDNTKWSSGDGLTLGTATVTDDLYTARNTLTHRILGPTSTATIKLDTSAMKDGDVAGLALLRDSSAWIGVKRAAGSSKIAMVNGLTMDGSWNTTGKGTEVASADASGAMLWLRITADIRPGANSKGRFYYSADGTTFTELGSGFTMKNGWEFFMGYRFGIFNYATQSLGGSVKVASFELEAAQ